MKLYNLNSPKHKQQPYDPQKHKNTQQMQYKQYMESRTPWNLHQSSIHTHNSPKHQRQKDIKIEYLSKQNQALLSQVVKHQQQQDKYRKYIKKLQRSKSQTMISQCTQFMPKSLRPKQVNNNQQFIIIKDYQQLPHLSDRNNQFLLTKKCFQSQLLHTSSLNQQNNHQTSQTTYSQRSSDLYLCQSLLNDKQALRGQIERLNDKLLTLIEYPTWNMTSQFKKLHRLQINQCVLQLKRLKKSQKDVDKCG